MAEARVIVKYANYGYETITINNKYEQLQSIIGGSSLIAIRITKDLYIIKDEYANYKNRPVNEYIEIVRANGVVEGFIMYGTFVIAKADFEKGEFVDITGDEADIALDLINGNKEYYARREVSCVC